MLNGHEKTIKKLIVISTVEIRMLDGHDATLLEKLVRVVVNQLTVNEDVAPGRHNFF